MRLPAISVVALFAAGCDDGEAPSNRGGEGPPSPPVPVSHDDYVGSQACRRCHEQDYLDWAASHHALAERDVSEELDATAFRGHAPVKHGSLESEVRERDGRMELVTLGRDGTVSPHAVVRAIGETPLRQYLVPQEGGRLQTAALTYDPHRNAWFDVFGEEDRRADEWGFWAQRGMNWNSMCADCHNTDVRKGYHAATDSYDTRYVELGVGCESCHGPGRAHVEWQDAHVGRSGDPTLPAMGLPTRKNAWIDTCAGCHSRRGELHDAPRPTDYFLDGFLPELPGLHELYYPDGQVLEEDYVYGSFLLSRMNHSGIVTCINCHDPHHARPRLEGNALCLQCHNGQLSDELGPIDPAAHSHHSVDAEGGQCVNCHMPETTYMQLDARRDHSFSVPDPQLTIELGIPNACNRCHTDQTPGWAAKWVDEWYGEKMERPQRRRARLVARARGGEAEAAPDLIAWLEEETYPAWKAVAASCLRAYTGDAAVRAALITALEDESALVRTNAVRALEQAAPVVPELVVPALVPCLDDPIRSVRVTAAWNLHEILDLDSQAGRELMEYLEHAADQPLGSAMQAQFWLGRGRPQRAVSLLRRAVEWDPNSGEFWRSLAVALDADDNQAEAAKVLGEAVERFPGDPELWFSLGLTRNAAGDLEGCIEALREAVKAEPRHAAAWYNLALALNAKGDREAALEAAERATGFEPSNPRFWYGRAAIARDAEEWENARYSVDRLLELFPGHREGRELLRWLQARR